MAPCASRDLGDVDDFLSRRFGVIEQLMPLTGGVWSQAFRFVADGRRLVIRFGDHVEDYAKDRLAASWAGPRLPIPAVFEIGEAFDGVYAISEHLDGHKLDKLDAEHLHVALGAVLDTLVALHVVELPGSGYGLWRAEEGSGSHPSWRQYLVSVPDRDDSRLNGWRGRLSATPGATDVFARAHAALVEMVDDCPDLRHVVHGDLLAGNVLISDDGGVSGLLDWGNSLAGDPAYDVAWLMFWAPWHPGIEADALRDAAAAMVGTDALEVRLLSAQLHIALDGMQYQAFAGRVDALEMTARRTTDLLRSI